MDFHIKSESAITITNAIFRNNFQYKESAEINVHRPEIFFHIESNCSKKGISLFQQNNLS